MSSQASVRRAPSRSSRERRSIVLLLALLSLAVGCGSDDLPTEPPTDPGPPAGASQMTNSSRTLPDSVGGSASVVWHSGNGLVYVSTNRGYLLELEPNTLATLRTVHLGTGRAHQLGSDGAHVYVHVDANGHEVLKIETSGLTVVARTPSLSGAGSPEGFIFLNGDLYVAVGGPPGKIVRIDPATMAVLGQWPLPGGIENHGFTTDGANLFVLGVPTRGTTPNKYFKLSPALALLGSITFSWNGNLGGNAYLPATGSVYAGAGRLTRINPTTFSVIGSSSFSTTSKTPLHWLAADPNWIYALDGVSPSKIRIFDPKTLAVVTTVGTGANQLHYGIVQNGFLWLAHEQVPGVVQRWTLYGPTTTSANQSPTVSITAPANNSTYTAPATITIDASAGDPDGTVSKVDFLANGSLLGSDNAAPFSFTWSGVAAGSYTLTARATDNAGAMATSAGVSVTVGAGASSPITVSVPAEADLYLDQSNPNTNYGTATSVSVGGGATRREAYFRFNVSGLPGTATVTDARLILWASNGSTDPAGGGILRKFDPVQGQWGETTHTWNLPILGVDGSGDLAIVGPVTAGYSYTWSGLQGVVTGNGLVTFVLRSNASDGSAFYSRQYSTTGRRPVLRITYTP